MKVPQPMKVPYLTVALAASALVLAGYLLRERLLIAASPQEPEVSIAAATNHLATARKLAWEAAVLVQNPPHSVERWQQAKVKWRQAIRLLEAIPVESAEVEVQERLTAYRKNYAAITDRLTTEQTATQNLAAAQTLAWQAAVTVQNPPHSLRVWQRAREKWQSAIALLEPISKTTSVSEQSRSKLTLYRANYRLIDRRIKLETQAMQLVKRFASTADRLNRLPSRVLDGATSEQLGLSHVAYTKAVQTLEQALNQFLSQPEAKNHPVYPELSQAIEDYKFALKLWNTYLDYEQRNREWLYDSFFHQLVPVSLEESSKLVNEYGVKTYFGGTKVSLRFAAWEIWSNASEHVSKAQRAALSFNVDSQ